MPLVDCRYAEALIEITERYGNTGKVLSDFGNLTGLIDNSPELEDYLENPQIQISSKKKLLKEMFENKIDVSLLKLIMLLVDKGRVKHIRGIMGEYKRLADKKRDVLNLKIISAVQLDELLVNKITEKYGKLYEKDEVKVVLNIDKSLIGGIKVQIGDRVEDFSLKTRLDSLKSMLLQE